MKETRKSVPSWDKTIVSFMGHAKLLEKLATDYSQLLTVYYLYNMTKMRKVALIGIASAVALTILAVIFGYPAAIAGVHALPFCMLLIIDSSRNKTQDQNKTDL